MQPVQQQLIDLQVKVSKILGLAFIFSIVWVAGIGSCAAFLLGVYALRLIKGSSEKIAGVGMAWWCIIAGAIGTAIMPFILFRK